MPFDCGAKDARLLTSVNNAGFTQGQEIVPGTVSTQYGTDWPEHANEFISAVDVTKGLERLSKSNPAYTVKIEDNPGGNDDKYALTASGAGFNCANQ